MNSNPKNKDNTSNFYSMNELFKDLKKLPINEKLETNKINESFRKNNTIEVELPKNGNNRYFYKSEMRDKMLNLSPQQNYTNEVVDSEIINMSKENHELKFCLDILNKKYEKEMKDLKLKNIKKIKEIQSTKEILKKNIALIELLGSKVVNCEEIIKQNEKKNNKIKSNENIEDKVLVALKEKEELEKGIYEREEIIKSYKDQIDSKKDMFEEVDKMKNDMEDCLKTMEELYKEITKKDEQIDDLKKYMELMNTKHEKEIEELSKSKEINLENASNDEILAEITRSKGAQIKMTKELVEIQKNYINAKNTNIKLENLTKEASDMIKKTIDSRNSIKKGYDKAIDELVEKYEKQIRFMKVVIVEQNEKFEKQLEEIKNDKNIEDNDNSSEDIEDKDDNNIDEKNKYLEKLKKDNIMLMEQNLELKNMNELLLKRMNEIPDLHNKFSELFAKVKLLKEENDLLKESLKNNKYLQIMSQEHEEEENEDEEKIIKEKKSLKNSKENNDNDNNEEDNKKLNLEEFILLESLLKDMDNNNGEEAQNKKELDINKLLMLENILRKIENKNGEDDKDDKETEYKKEKEENEYEEKKNKKEQLLLKIKLKSLRERELDENNIIEKNMLNINNNPKIQNNKLNKEELKNSNHNKSTKIYNKKFFKSSPKTIKTAYDNKKYLKKINNDSGEEIENDEKEDGNNEEEDEDENAQNQININFNLFKPTKEGILAFNLSRKIYSTTIPENFEEFSMLFDPNTSVQYNTLEGLFIIPSNKSNKLFYYSSKNNIINELFSLKENHAGGCLLLDNSSKYIIALGGYESKVVEKFTFETDKLEQLSEMPTCRSKISCNQIGNKLYCFFGISKQKPNKSIVEYLDLDNIKEGWIDVNFKNNTNYNVISGMSCINLNDNELLIIGGLLNDKIPNETLLYFNIEDKVLNKIEKNLPDSEDKVYIFTQNTMFNFFVNGEIISFANIDNNNNVHILDNDLCYDLYLTPKINYHKLSIKEKY